MIIELMAARQRDAERIQQDKTRINELLSKVNELLSMQKAFVTAKKQLDDYKQMVGTLLSKITALEERLKVCNKNLYASKSQKGINKRSGKPKRTTHVTRIILTALPNPSNPHCCSMAMILCVKKTRKQNPRRFVFVIKDCLIAPWVPTIRFAIIVIFVNCPQVQ